jgi:membrane protease YdiL (CAAX protease family)
MGGEAESPRARPGISTALALAFAMTWPTVLAWVYFIALGGAGQASRAQQLTYAGGKVTQFAFPLGFLWLTQRQLRVWRRPTLAGLGWGVGFGVAVALMLFAAYYGGLRSSPLLAQTPERIRHKLQEFGLASPAGYLLAALFLSVVHSLLEEYYWRWFVFGRLRRFLPFTPALVLASLAFTSHHVLVLWVLLPGKVLLGVLPAAVGLAVGGGVWAWIYERDRSLLAPWLSHAILDAALFVVGWDLLQRVG